MAPRDKQPGDIAGNFQRFPSTKNVGFFQAKIVDNKSISALEGVVPASIFEELSAATPSWVGPALLPGQSQDCQVLLARAQESHVLAARDQDARVPRDHDTTSTTVTDVPFNVHNPASMILNLANCE